MLQRLNKQCHGMSSSTTNSIIKARDAGCECFFCSIMLEDGVLE
jgi:hypothetical protein